MHVMDAPLMDDAALLAFQAEPPTGSAVLISEGQVLAGPGVTINHSDFATRGQAPGNAYEPFASVTFAGREWQCRQNKRCF